MKPIMLGKYKLFKGDTYQNLMPQLVASGLSPVSFADIMRARLESIKTNTKKDLRLSDYFNSGDGVAYNNNRMKIVYDAPQLRTIDKATPLSLGALILSPEEYDASEGIDFSRDSLDDAGIDRFLTMKEAKSHPIWLALARGDQYLLSEYADLMFAGEKTRNNYDQLMGVYLASEQTEPTMRAWFLGGFGRGSYAGGRSGLNYYDARLLGVDAVGALQNSELEKKVLKALQ